MGQSFDTEYRHFIIPEYDNCEALIVYISGLVDTKVIEKDVLAPLMDCPCLPEEKYFAKRTGRIRKLIQSGVFVPFARETNQWRDLCDAVMEGDTVLFLDGSGSALILSAKKNEFRSIEEPEAETEVRGARDGFVENAQTNAALIRRRIKDYNLRFENLKIGERTKTVVILVYIESLVNESILKEVRTRLNRINVDGILESAYIEEFIEDSPNSVFPQIENTERPDKASAAILGGRIAILVDNTPFVLMVPTVFWNFIESSGDYYQRYHIGTFLRWLRFLSLFLSISLSSLYVLLTSFHQEMIPTSLALNIAAGRTGVPFPAVIEAFIMEIMLEIIKEAGLRMPKAIGQTVGFVGALIIGQGAVAAGLVGPALVIAIAIAAICSFAIPAYNMNNSLRLIKFPLIFLSAIFGILGYLAGIMAILLHLLSLRSFGAPFLAPAVPLDKSGFRNVFIRAPRWSMKERPGYSSPKEVKRQTGRSLNKPGPLIKK
ncbi:spore germination protein [Pelotomaculum propionicicum]|uniref:spore germination protein n=1 Tax=Pelotomaculum propionicicum TaxID=258475 RepID=UPI003B7650AD